MDKDENSSRVGNSRISQHQLELAKLQINPIDVEPSLLMTPMILDTEQDLTPVLNQESPLLNDFKKVHNWQRASLAKTESVRKESEYIED